MKRFLLRLAAFAVLMVVCDAVVGYVCSSLMENSKDGIGAKKTYMCNVMEEDIIIFGSSRAYRHYSPDVFEDVIGMSVYNCGLSNSGIIGTYCLYKMIEKRFCPKIIIYDIYTPDLLTSDNHTYLGNFRPFYNREGVDSIFWDVDPTERYKMLSHMYWYNSIFPTLVRELYKPKEKFDRGAIMTSKTMLSTPKPQKEKETYEYDSLKLYYLERLINDCKGKTQLVFTVSPLYEETGEEVLTPIKALCGEYGIPLISHYTDSTFHHRNDYFYDGIHLNRIGATEYSKAVASEIKSLLIQKHQK